jgi:sugar lactone lactonase YvrE
MMSDCQLDYHGKAGEMSVTGRIVRVDPAAGIPGGEVVIECSGYDTSYLRACYPLFGASIAQTVGLSSRRVLAIVPDAGLSGETEVLLSSGGQLSAPARFIVGTKLADDLHPVANPAFDPDDGSLFVTRSGPRGQQMPVSIFRIDAKGELDAFSGDITNPTGIAFDPSGQMYVSSRLDGTVYRISHFKEPVAFAQNLGVATGIAFDAEGRLYVGDRTGTIYRVNGIGEERAYAQLEPSVSAYHLAFGPDHHLYVTGPTVSSYDSIMRIDENGDASVFYRGLGRPQGLAFDREGNLYVAASLRGRRGIVRISPDGAKAEMVVAGMNVIGLAFSAGGEMAVVTTEAVYTLPMGIYGTLLK